MIRPKQQHAAGRHGDALQEREKLAPACTSRMPEAARQRGSANWLPSDMRFVRNGRASMHGPPGTGSFVGELALARRRRWAAEQWTCSFTALRPRLAADSLDNDEETVEYWARETVRRKKKSLRANDADFKSPWNWKNARGRTRATPGKKNLRRTFNPQKYKTTVVRACFGKQNPMALPTRAERLFIRVRYV